MKTRKETALLVILLTLQAFPQPNSSPLPFFLVLICLTPNILNNFGYKAYFSVASLAVYCKFCKKFFGWKEEMPFSLSMLASVTTVLLYSQVE